MGGFRLQPEATKNGRYAVHAFDVHAVD